MLDESLMEVLVPFLIPRKQNAHCKSVVILLDTIQTRRQQNKTKKKLTINV